MKAIAIVSGLAAATAFMGAGVAAQAQNTSLAVNTTVVGYCAVRLANVSSGTASIAQEAEQQVANLQLACNGTKATLTVNPLNGDFKNGNNLINYSMRLNSATEPAFNIATTDATPGDAENSGKFTRVKNGYSQPLANGVDAQFWLNVNVAAVGPVAEGQIMYPANAAPAGNYTESFTFELSSL